MTLKELSKQKSAALQAEHQRALDDVKRPLKPGADFARKEIPPIEAALVKADGWRRENLEEIRQACGGIPRSIADLLPEIEKARNVPSTLRDMLKRYDALTWQYCWGNRADGERDRNRAANVRGEFDFGNARGCVSRIEDLVRRLQFERQRIDDQIKWDSAVGDESDGVGRRLITPPGDGPVRLTVIDNLPHD